MNRTNKIFNRLLQIKLSIILLQILCLVFLGLSSCDFAENSNSSLPPKENNADSLAITIENFTETEYFMEIGDTQSISISLSPKNLEISDIMFSIADSNIISVSNQNMQTGWFSQNSQLSFTVIANSEGTTTLYVMSADGTIKSNEVVFTVQKQTKVESFGKFKQNSATIYIDDTQDVSWPIYPKESREVLREDFELKISDESIISINEASLSKEGNIVYFNFSITGLLEGNTDLTLQSSNGKIVSDSLKINVTVAPIIRSFGKFEQSGYYMETGDTIKFSHHIWPIGLLREDVIIEITDESVISITENSFGDEDDSSLFVYTITALSEGESTLTLSASDGKTNSDPLTFHVSKKDTSRTVYTTPTGERYHFSAACAGENSSSCTLNQAKSMGYTPCKKCAS